MIECQEAKSRNVCSSWQQHFQVFMKCFFSLKEFSRGGWKKANARGALVVLCFNLFVLNSFLNW